MSLGIEQRYLFVQSKKSERKSFFILQSFTLFNDGLGSEPGDTGIFFSISIGKNFHFNEHSGLALDLGADISLSDTWDSLLGPRLQFYF